MGKLKTEFTSPIAKSTSPGLSDTTFFARWLFEIANESRKEQELTSQGALCGMIQASYMYNNHSQQNKWQEINDHIYSSWTT